jgi:ferredoxin
MIFYFSGTGNSKWVAEQIANKINEKVVAIADIKDVLSTKDEKIIGLVFPIYAWGVAEPMLQFTKKLQKTNAFTFGICTCAMDAGLAMKKLSTIFKLDSCYSVTMPSNYIVGADVEDERIINEKIAKAKIDLDAISVEILENKKVYRVNEGAVAFLKSNFATMGFNKFARNTKPFFADVNCIGCGLCAKECPAKTITIRDSKPTWGKQCYKCMKCINSCPKKAIQYGKKTANRGRYNLNECINLK